MKYPLAFVAFLFAALLARADVIIVQKVESPSQSGEMTVKVSGDKVRTDVSAQISTITDASSGNVTTLLHAQKAYVIISASTTKAMIDQMTKVMQQAGTNATPSAPKATGTTDTINGYKAEAYAFDNGIITATYWVAKDFPNAKEIGDALATFRKGNLADMTKAFAPDLSNLPGIPVKTEMEFRGQKITTEIESTKVQAIDPKDFQVPSDYTEMKLPAGSMPGPSQ